MPTLPLLPVVLASLALAQPAWPPALDVGIQCGDVAGFATLTVQGVWNDACVPQRMEAAAQSDGSVLLTVYHEYAPGTFCLQVLRPYELAAEVILFDGDYPVFITLDSTLIPDRPAEPLGLVRVRCLPRCFADFNEDGGVDGGDIEAFFIAWEASDPLADANYDGGIDGADVQAFFEVWEAGGC